jgi:lysine-N-methylase
MKNRLKVDIYDKFVCIADRCSFSCCEGWDILVDTDTYQKWANSDASSYLCDNVRSRRVKKDTGYYMKLERGKHCPFLREDNLCNMVVTQGEECLPKTCREFPRLIHRKDECTEYSLSCACPVVIDLLKENAGLLQFTYEGDEDRGKGETLSGKLRDTMLFLLQHQSYTLRDRLLLIFQLLLTVREYADEDHTGDMLTVKLAKVIEDYKEEEICSEIISLWSKVPFDTMDTLLERNELFLDIIQNYKTEKSYQGNLKAIDQYAQNLEAEQLPPKFDRFVDKMRDYEQLLVNFLVTKVFAYCIQEELEALIMSYQMIVTEYVMVLHATYLRQRIREDADKKKEIQRDSQVLYQELKEDMVLFSRIIGYNIAGMKEFWEDSFDEPVWEIGYLLLLLS